MDNKKKFEFANIKSLKSLPKKQQLLILVLLGILLLVIALPVPKNKKDSGTPESTSSESESLVQTNSELYEENLEKRVSQTLEKVEGVGKTDVMITLKSSSQKIVEKDQQTSSQQTNEEDSQGGTRTAEDTSTGKTSVYEQSSEGGQTPYVSKELTPEIKGVVVIAEGGDNPVVVQNITEAIEALFGVEAHKIKIMKRNIS